MPKFKVGPDSRVWSYEEESQKLIEMKPVDFLRLTGHLPEEFRASPMHSQDSYDSIHAALERSETIDDPPFLDVNVDTGEIIGHEGRHRALAAHDLGISRIPVVLFAKRRNKPSRFDLRQYEFVSADELRGVTLHPKGMRHIAVGPFRRPHPIRSSSSGLKVAVRRYWRRA